MSAGNTPYINISCFLYDQLEAYATMAVSLKIVYESDSGTSIEVISRICNLQTKNKEEFALLEDNQWVRLDRIISLTIPKD